MLGYLIRKVSYVTFVIVIVRHLSIYVEPPLASQTIYILVDAALVNINHDIFCLLCIIFYEYSKPLIHLYEHVHVL